MATKFKKGDIVRITKILPTSPWFKDSTINGKSLFDIKIKIRHIVYYKYNRSYFMTGNIIDLNDEFIACAYIKIKRV